MCIDIFIFITHTLVRGKKSGSALTRASISQIIIPTRQDHRLRSGDVWFGVVMRGLVTCGVV